MRFYSTALVSALVSSALLTGCLPAYNGKSPNDAGKTEDLYTEEPIQDFAGIDFTAPPVLVDGGSTGTLSITLDKPAQSLRLNETMVVNVTITPSGQTGSATLSLAKAPTGVTATFNPASVTLGTAPVTSVMTVTAASNMVPVSNIAAEVTATVGGSASTTTYGVTVVPKLIIRLAKGMQTNGGGHAVAGFPKSVPVLLPASGSLPVDFYNDDTIEHEIHADGNSLGMAHEGGALGANGAAMYETTITAVGTAKIYCHVHGGTADGTGTKPAPADEGTIVVTQ